MKKMLCEQNSAPIFLTHVSPASLLDGSSRRIRIEKKLCRGSRLATCYSKALKRTNMTSWLDQLSWNGPVGSSLEVTDDDDFQFFIILTTIICSMTCVQSCRTCQSIHPTYTRAQLRYVYFSATTLLPLKNYAAHSAGESRRKLTCFSTALCRYCLFRGQY
jgi:hypothetical protein